LPISSAAKAVGDASYNVNFDFGGAGGTETPGRVQSLYVQHDGLGPFAVRVGAYPWRTADRICRPSRSAPKSRSERSLIWWKGVFL